MWRVLAGGIAALLLAGSAAAADTPAPPPPDPAELSEARAIIGQMYPPAEQTRMVDTMMADLTAQFGLSIAVDKVDDTGLKEILDDYMATLAAQQRPLLEKRMPDMLEAIAVAYVNEFSLAELKDIHAFAQSPSGQRYLSRSTAVLSDPAIATVNTALMNDVMQLSSVLRQGVQQKVITYLNAHPDVAKKLAERAVQQ